MIGMRRRQSGMLLNSPPSSDQPLLGRIVERRSIAQDRGDRSEPSIIMPLIVLVVLGMAIAAVSPVFLNERNLLNMLSQASMLAPLAIGMTFVFLVRGIDFSVGGLIALTSFVTATVDNSSGWQAALLAALAVGMVCGLVQGILVSRWVLPAFFVTFVGGIAFEVAATMLSGGGMIRIGGDLGWLSLGRPGSIPASLIISGGVAVVAYLMLRRLRRSIDAVSSGEAEPGSKRTWIAVGAYVVMGFCSALSAFMLTARYQTFTPNIGSAFQLAAIAAVVIGGASFFGRSGSILGSLIGAGIIAVMANGAALAGLEGFWHPILVGGLALIAAIYYSHGRSR